MDRVTEPESLPVQSKQQLDFNLDRTDFIVEANFLNVPLFNFDRNHRGGTKNSIVHQFTEAIGEANVVRTVHISVAGKTERGKPLPDHLPNAFDHDVWIVLMDLWDEQGRPANGVVYFRQHDICKRLEITDGGKNYQRIRESIARLRRTTIESANAFYSAARAKHVIASVGFIADYYFERGTRGGGRNQDRCWVQLNSVVLENLKRDYSAKINRRLYLNLRHGFAKRLANLITFQRDVQLKTDGFDFLLEDLANRLPISGSRAPSKILERLKPSLEELQEKGLFNWTVVNASGRSFLRLIPLRLTEELVGVAALDRFWSLFQEVYGTETSLKLVTETEVKELLERYPRVVTFRGRKYSWVYHLLTVLAWQLRGGYKADDPRALLVARLRKGSVDPPLGFKSVEIEASETAERIRAENLAEERRIQELKIQRNFELLADRYLSAMTQEERDKYEKRVIAIYEGNPPTYCRPGTKVFDATMRAEVIRDMKENAIDVERLNDRLGRLPDSDTPQLEFRPDGVSTGEPYVR